MPRKPQPKPKPKSSPLPTAEEMAETQKRIRLEAKYRRTQEQRHEDVRRIHAVQPELPLRELAREAGVSFVLVRALMELEDPDYLAACLKEAGTWRRGGQWRHRPGAKQRRSN